MRGKKCCISATRSNRVSYYVSRMPKICIWHPSLLHRVISTGSYWQCVSPYNQNEFQVEFHMEFLKKP